MSEKRFYHLTAKDEPNIGVIAFKVKEENSIVLNKHRAEAAFLHTLRDHFDAEVKLEGEFPERFVIGCEMNIPVIVDSTEEYHYDITVRHTWVYEE